jgi:CheY-like chemotaxis protein
MPVMIGWEDSGGEKMAVDYQMRILLVEDSKLTRKMEVNILKEVGFQHVVEANDGEEAIQKLQEEGEIDLILSDWNMQGG